MLRQLNINNLAIIAKIELTFADGMHVITGETGSGKSILIEALTLILGERANCQQVRPGEKMATITAIFDLSEQDNKAFTNILEQYNISIAKDSIYTICRQIYKDGRSRAYCNDQLITVNILKKLQPFLLNIHSQHQQSNLCENSYQREILDNLITTPGLLQQVKQCYLNYQAITEKLNDFANHAPNNDTLELLNYQVQELNDLNLSVNEYRELDDKQRQLAETISAQQNFYASHALLTNESTGILSQLHKLKTYLSPYQNHYAISIAWDEAQPLIANLYNLSEHLAQINLDHEEIMQEYSVVEARLSQIYQLARKFKVSPEHLFAHHQDLVARQQVMQQHEQHVYNYTKQQQQASQQYYQAAQLLSQVRVATAQEYSIKIENLLPSLAFHAAKFTIVCTFNANLAPAMHGVDDIKFLFSDNPGQPIQELHRVASGGELSRLQLAIENVMVNTHTQKNSLIFDEIDTGISGNAANQVGQQLKKLSMHHQIICVTHLPQVAAFADHHYQVSKLCHNNYTETQVLYLDEKHRIQEIARLLGGKLINAAALHNAEQLIELAN